MAYPTMLVGQAALGNSLNHRPGGHRNDGQGAVFLDHRGPLCKQSAPRRGRGYVMKTISLSAEQIEKNWWVIDLDNKVLGRAATKISTLLRGKNKPSA